MNFEKIILSKIWKIYFWGLPEYKDVLRIRNNLYGQRLFRYQFESLWIITFATYDMSQTLMINALFSI